eukprot:g876.t1
MSLNDHVHVHEAAEVEAEHRHAIDVLAAKHAAELSTITSQLEQVHAEELAQHKKKLQKEKPRVKVPELKAEWFYENEFDEPHGPVGVSELKQLWRMGDINAETLCWSEKITDSWKKIGSLPRLQHLISSWQKDELKFEKGAVLVKEYEIDSLWWFGYVEGNPDVKGRFPAALLEKKRSKKKRMIGQNRYRIPSNGQKRSVASTSISPANSITSVLSRSSSSSPISLHPHGRIPPNPPAPPGTKRNKKLHPHGRQAPRPPQNEKETSLLRKQISDMTASHIESLEKMSKSHEERINALREKHEKEMENNVFLESNEEIAKRKVAEMKSELTEEHEEKLNREHLEHEAEVTDIKTDHQHEIKQLRKMLGKEKLKSLAHLQASYESQLSAHKGNEFRMKARESELLSDVKKRTEEIKKIKSQLQSAENLAKETKEKHSIAIEEFTSKYKEIQQIHRKEKKRFSLTLEEYQIALKEKEKAHQDSVKALKREQIEREKKKDTAHQKALERLQDMFKNLELKMKDQNEMLCREVEENQLLRKKHKMELSEAHTRVLSKEAGKNKALLSKMENAHDKELKEMEKKIRREMMEKAKIKEDAH